MEEKKDVPKPKKVKRTTKADLKKELDSLKMMMMDLSKKEPSQKRNIKKIEDSLLQNFQHQMNIRKDNEISYKNIKKYDFIRENVIKKMSMPLDRMLITSPFGFRTHPIFGGRKMHNGIDLGANYENVYAVLDGVVSEADWDNKGGGNYIKVRHSNRFEFLFALVGDVLPSGRTCNHRKKRKFWKLYCPTSAFCSKRVRSFY